jgi:hypothetical protein
MRAFVDGLSLAMFEALRGLRDAATLEDDVVIDIDVQNKGNGMNNSNSNNHQNKKNSIVLQQDSVLVQKLVDAVFEKSHAIDQMLDNNFVILPQTDVTNTDTDTTKKKKKKKTSTTTATATGSNQLMLFQYRTRDEQMKYIQELIEKNNVMTQELYNAVQETIHQRNQCRKYVLSSNTTNLLLLNNNHNDDVDKISDDNDEDDDDGETNNE